MTTTQLSEVMRLAKIGRRAETRRAARNGCLSALAKLTVYSLFGGVWLWMLAAAIHAWWIPQVPRISYWHAIWIAALIRQVVAQFTPDTPKREAGQC